MTLASQRTILLTLSVAAVAGLAILAMVGVDPVRAALAATGAVTFVVVASLANGVWRQARMLRQARACLYQARRRHRAAEKIAGCYRAELEVLRARQLDELTGSVQGLLTYLTERGQELDEEENWWKQGQPRDDEP